MPVLVWTGQMHHVFYEAIRPSFHLFICYQSHEHDVLKTRADCAENWHQWSTGQGDDVIYV